MSEPGDDKDRRTEEDRRLEDFARRLTESLPELSEDAMQRVGQAMRGEVRRVRRRQRLLKSTWIASLAAGLLLAVGILAIRNGAGPRPGQGKGPEDEIAVTEDQSEIRPGVEDRFVMVVTVADGATSDPPLLRLEDYRSLIEEVN